MAQQAGQATPGQTGSTSTSASGSGSGSGPAAKPSMWNRSVAKAGSMADSTVQGIKESSVRKIVTRIRVISIVCAVFTLAIGIYGFTAIPNCDNCWMASYVVVGIYTTGTPLFLLVVELLLYTSKTGKWTLRIKKGLRIVYTIRGRGLFVMFMGTLCWSSLSNTWGEWIVNVVFGTVVFLLGFYIILAYYKHPTLSKVHDPFFIEIKSETDEGPDLENPPQGTASANTATNVAGGQTSTSTAGANPAPEAQEVAREAEVKHGEAVKEKEVASANVITSWWRKRKS